MDIHSRNQGYERSLDGISSVTSIRRWANVEPSVIDRRKTERTTPIPWISARFAMNCLCNLPSGLHPQKSRD